MNIYVVQAGDTVQSIGGAFGLSPEEIIYLNQLAYPYGLALGQALLLPTPGINSGSIFQRQFFMPILLLTSRFCRKLCRIFRLWRYSHMALARRGSWCRRNCRMNLW